MARGLTSGDCAHLSDEQRTALAVEAFLADVPGYAVRRRALEVYADGLLRDPAVRVLVDEFLAYRRRQDRHLHAVVDVPPAEVRLAL